MTTAATSQGISGIKLTTQFLTTDTLSVSRNATIADLTVTGTADFTQAQSITGIGTIANGTNVGPGAGLYRDATTVGNTRTLNFRSIASSDDVIATQNGTSIILSLDTSRPFNNLVVSGLSTIGALSASGNIITSNNSVVTGTINYGGVVTGIVPSKLDLAVGGLKRGDLLVYNSSGNLVKLPVGAPGEVLSASLDSVGLKWVTLINLPAPSVSDVIGSQTEGTLIYAQSSTPTYGLTAPFDDGTSPVGYLRYNRLGDKRWEYNTNWSSQAVDITTPILRLANISASSINIGTSGTFYTEVKNANINTVKADWIIPFDSSSTTKFTSPSDTITRSRLSMTGFNNVRFVLGSVLMDTTETWNIVDNDAILSSPVRFTFARSRKGSSLDRCVTLKGFTVTAPKNATLMKFTIPTSSFVPYFAANSLGGPFQPCYTVPFILKTTVSFVDGNGNVTYNTTTSLQMFELTPTLLILRHRYTLGVIYEIPTITLHYRG